MVESRPLFNLNVFLAVVYFGFFVVVWADVLYAYGAAWNALLSALVLAVAASNIARNEVHLYKKRKYSEVIKVLTLMAIGVTLVSAVLSAISPPVNGPDRFLKPIFSFLLLHALGSFFHVLIVTPAANPASLSVYIPGDTEALVEKSPKEAEEEENLEEEPKETRCLPKCARCCRETCLVILLLLVMLAGLYTAIFFGRARNFKPGENILEGEEEFLVNANPDNPDQKIAFKCAGSGEPLVVFHHGYSGQGLDFAHVFDDLKEVTRVCTFDRLGYGQSLFFGPNLRVSSKFAQESAVAFEALNFPNDLFFVGHSMAGFNMLAFDLAFPGRIKGMVMVDPVSAADTSDCFTGGQNINRGYNNFGRLVGDSGFFLLFDLFNLVDLFAPISSLPETVQAEYKHNLFKTDYFETSINEGINWGETCEFVRDVDSVDYPLTVLIPERGIYEGRVDVGLNLANLSANGKPVEVPGDDAFHVEMVFARKFANFITEETLLLIEEYRAENNITNSSSVEE